MDNMYLQHMTPEEKAEYNRQYYQKHKYDIWGIKRGNSSCSPILGASAQRPKNVTGSTTLMSYKKLQPRQKNVTGKGSVDVIKPHGKYDTGSSTLSNRFRSKTKEDWLNIASSKFSQLAANEAREEARKKTSKTLAGTKTYRQNSWEEPQKFRTVTIDRQHVAMIPVSSIKYSKIDEYKRRTKAHLDSFGKAWKSGANDLINAGKSIWNKLFG